MLAEYDHLAPSCSLISQCTTCTEEEEDVEKEEEEEEGARETCDGRTTAIFSLHDVGVGLGQTQVINGLKFLSDPIFSSI